MASSYDASDASPPRLDPKKKACSKPLLDISRWGPAYWTAFHISAFDLDATKEGDRLASLRALLVHFPSILPCSVCSQHLREVYASHPVPRPDPSGSGSIVARWSVRVHNAVNARLNRPILSFEEAVALYFQCGPPCSVQTTPSLPDRSGSSGVAERTGAAAAAGPGQFLPPRRDLSRHPAKQQRLLSASAMPAAVASAGAGALAAALSARLLATLRGVFSRV